MISHSEPAGRPYGDREREAEDTLQMMRERLKENFEELTNRNSSTPQDFEDFKAQAEAVTAFADAMGLGHSKKKKKGSASERGARAAGRNQAFYEQTGHSRSWQMGN